MKVDQSSLRLKKRALSAFALPSWRQFHNKLILTFWLGGVVTLVLCWAILAYQPISNRLPRYCHHLDVKSQFINQNNDVVVLGDSTALVGIDPLVSEQYSPSKIVNLAISASEHPDGWYNVLCQTLLLIKTIYGTD